MIKWSIPQKCITILNVSAPNHITFNYMRQTWLNWKEKVKPIIIFRDINTSHSVMDRISRHKISKDIKDLNIIDQFGLTDVYRTHHSRTENSFFSSVHEIVTKIRPYVGLSSKNGTLMF